MSHDTKLIFNAFIILVSLLAGIDIRYMHKNVIIPRSSLIHLNSSFKITRHFLMNYTTV